MPIVLKSGSLNLLESSGPVQACNGIALPLPLPLPYSYRLLIYNQFSLADKLPENILSQELLTLNERVSFVLYDRCVQGSFYISPVAKLTQFSNLNMFPCERFISYQTKNKQTTFFIFYFLYFEFCLLFCTMTNKSTINSQIITLLLHVSTLLCHPQEVRSYYLAKLRKYVKCSCW